MKLYTRLPENLKPYFDQELQQYSKEYQPLERAHIIGQRYPYAHSYVHWKMLLFGIRIKSTKEVIGQIPRLIFGGVKSFVGTVPVGNPGGANVPALKSFPIAEDINKMFIEAQV